MILRLIFDPFGNHPQRVSIYLYLALFFGRLALWYWIDERYGREGFT